MTAPLAQETILSTLQQDGSRVWIRPRLSHGRFLNARRIVAYVLFAIFVLLPSLRINAKPLILLDIVHRRFTLFGYTFLPTDTVLLALLLLGLFVGIFLCTAIFGRLWCGWACPQTVYLEFIYRPLERIFEGTAGTGGKPAKELASWRRPAYFLVAALVSILPAHTFLAYFVGWDQLAQWVRGSPLQHPIAFTVMAATTLLMLFDFHYFREQLCILACPYGRFQSVLLDPFSLIISYDSKRGEPRGKLCTQGAGDCVDCHLCVVTCPTGIDIRQGLQMECVSCTQCIDACDAVMTKLKRPKGLIRYGSQAAIEKGDNRFFRPRLIFYPAIILIIATIWLAVFHAKGTADVTVLRNFGMPFTQLASGDISNSIRLKVTNRTDHDAAYQIEVIGAPQVRLVADENPLPIAPGASRTEGFLLLAPPQAFQLGIRDVQLRITDGAGFDRQVPCRLLGPAIPSAREPDDSHKLSNEEGGRK